MKKLLKTTAICLLIFCVSVSFATASPSSAPDALFSPDRLYSIDSMPDPAPVTLSTNGLIQNSGGAAFAAVTHDSSNNTIMAEYGLTNVMGINNKTPVPGDIYSSIATFTNDTSDIWVLDTAEMLHLYLWVYIQANSSYPTTAAERLAIYNQQIDNWMVFKFDMTGPDGTSRQVSPSSSTTSYSTISDFDDYYLPTGANANVSSTNGNPNRFAQGKATVPQIVLKPGDSMQVPWEFGMTTENNNPTRRTIMDSSFTLIFKQAQTYKINYYKDSVGSPSTDDPNYLGTNDGKSVFALNPEHTLTEGEVTADFEGEDWINAFRPEGYNDGSVVDDYYPVITVDIEKNVVNVLYVKPAPKVYPYTVKYYKDSVSETNLLGTTSGTTSFVADYQLLESDVTADLLAGWLNAQKPSGYENGEVQNGYPVITIDPETNIVIVLYKPTPEQPKPTGPAITTGEGITTGSPIEPPVTTEPPIVTKPPVIPPVPPEPQPPVTPPTGDEAPLNIWYMMAAIGLAGVLLCAFAKRRQMALQAAHSNPAGSYLSPDFITQILMENKDLNLRCSPYRTQRR